MPILAVWPKQGTASIEPKNLSHFLCPYQGQIRTRVAGGGTIFASEIVDLGEEVLIPKGTHKAPNTAWLSVKVEPESSQFETDPLGTFPLWIYEDDHVLMITSEVKSLQATELCRVEFKDDLTRLGCKYPKAFSPYLNVRRLEPSAIVIVDHKNLSLTVESRSVLKYYPEDLFTTAQEAEKALLDALCESASCLPRDLPTVTFLSGGIDSGISTALLQKTQPNLHTLTLGTEFGDEFEEAKELSDHLHVSQSKVIASTQKAKYHFQKAVFAAECWDGLTAETLAQLSLLAREAAPKYRQVATGYGSDLLFGSMLSHKLYLELTGVIDLQSLIERTAWTGEFCPFFAWAQGVTVHHIFWHPKVMNTAFRIPMIFNSDGPKDKMVLRRAAVNSGLMLRNQAFRTKKALTDGTQFNRVLSKAIGLDDFHAYEGKGIEALLRLKEFVAHD